MLITHVYIAYIVENYLCSQTKTTLKIRQILSFLRKSTKEAKRLLTNFQIWIIVYLRIRFVLFA